MQLAQDIHGHYGKQQHSIDAASPLGLTMVVTVAISKIVVDISMNTQDVLAVALL